MIRTITEGKDTIVFDCDGNNGVFYNNVQEFNRDISVVAIKAFVKCYSGVGEIAGEGGEG